MNNRIHKIGGEKSELTPYLPYFTQQKPFVLFVYSTTKCGCQRNTVTAPADTILVNAVC
jgi:hypothetical protein